LVLRRFLLVIVVGVVAYVAMRERFVVEHSYSLPETRACLERNGREVRYYRAAGGLPTLEVGPFDRGEPSEVLEFAATPDEADTGRYRDSDAMARRGNVLSPTSFSDPASEACLAGRLTGSTPLATGSSFARPAR